MNYNNNTGFDVHQCIFLLCFFYCNRFAFHSLIHSTTAIVLKNLIEVLDCEEFFSLSRNELTEFLQEEVSSLYFYGNFSIQSVFLRVYLF